MCEGHEKGSTDLVAWWHPDTLGYELSGLAVDFWGGSGNIVLNCSGHTISIGILCT